MSAVDEARNCAAARRVDEKIAAAVAVAPPLPDDVAARLTDLIRATPAPRVAESLANSIPRTRLSPRSTPVTSAA